jgi:thiosulfate/3-mercaptopyruvate sulfurtransferase
VKRLIDQSEIPVDAILIDARPTPIFEAGHAPGARNAEFLEKFVIRNDEQLIMFEVTLERLIQNLGLYGNESVVVYDAGPDTRASRLAWALEYAGFERVFVLRQGAPRDVSETGRSYVTKSDFKLKPNRAVLATADDILARAANTIVIDTRNDAEFAGSQIPPGATRGGHIPGAVHLDWQQLADHDGIKATAELDAMLESISNDQEIIVHCQSGARSSVVYHALKERGYAVKNYLGSMNEWLNDPELPIEQGKGKG